MKHLKTPGVSFLVYILVIFFGSSTWLSVTAVWVELPLMVSVYQLPESWSLPSYLAVIVQLAVIGPLLYWLCKKLCPKYISNPTPLIYICMAFCSVATLFLAIFWNYTSFVLQNTHSTALFVLLFCVSLISCTSSVLYLPTMFRFRPAYTTAYFIGMGFSALIPSVLALIQGAGRVLCVETNSTNSNDSESSTVLFLPHSIEPNFSVSLFYGFIFIWMCLASVAFVFLNVLPVAKKEMNIQLEKNNPKSIDEEQESHRLSPETNGDDYKSVEKAQFEETPAQLTKSSPVYIFLLILTFWSCALMNGILPSIQSFACLPYGTTIFHASVILSNIANPTACFVPFFYNLKNVFVISFLSLLSTCLSIYIIVLAASSPTALLDSNYAGSILCVLAWTFDVALLAYLRTVAGSILRESGNEKYLFWCGLCTQAGSFVGAMVMFPLVNFYEVFHAAPFCQ